MVCLPLVAELWRQTSQSAANQNWLAGSRKGKDTCFLSDGFNLLKLDMGQLMEERS